MRSPRLGRFTALVCTLVIPLGGAGCTPPPLTPAGKLVDATDAQFIKPVSVAVTAGATGMESPGPRYALSWLTSTEADVTVTNNSQRSPVIDVVATVLAPPCPGMAEVVIHSPGSKTIKVVAGSTGTPLSLRLNVPLGQSKTIRLSVLTPVCHIATDARPLYAGLLGLKAQTP